MNVFGVITTNSETDNISNEKYWFEDRMFLCIYFPEYDWTWYKTCKFNTATYIDNIVYAIKNILECGHVILVNYCCIKSNVKIVTLYNIS